MSATKLQTELFHIVRTHLLTQNKKSVSSIGDVEDELCMYHGPDGLKCAIGCLITDENYSPNLEGTGIYDSTVSKAVTKSLLARGIIKRAYLGVKTIEFLRSLQTIHDAMVPNRWREDLNLFAKTRGIAL